MGFDFSELVVLYEVSSLSLPRQKEDLVEDIIEKANRLLEVQKLALVEVVDNVEHITHWGFSDGIEEARESLRENKENAFTFSMEGRLTGWLYLEQDGPLSPQDIKIYTVFARKIEETLGYFYAKEALRESEEKHRILFETMAQGVIYQAADETIISANPAAERILGLSFEQMQGKTSMDPRWKMIEEDGTAVPGTEHPTMIALRTGEKVGPVTRGIFRPDKNAHVWLNITAIPLFQSGEKDPFQAYATFEDITERKQMEEALETSEERLDLAMAVKNEGYWDWDLVTDETFFDDRYYTMAGYAPKEFPQTFSAWAERVHPDDLPSAESSIQTYLAGKSERFDVEFRFKHKNGSWIWIRGQGKIVERDATGLPLRMIGTHTDITERKLAEQKLADYTRELEQLYRYLDQEISKAQQVHEQILPQSLPAIENISFAAYYQPAEKMGGDFYDLIHRGNKLIFYLSDVSGHGMDGAMLSFFVKNTISSYIDLTPAETIAPKTALNYLAEKFYRETFPEELYIAIFLAVLDLDTLELTYSGAGFQEKPLVRLGSDEQLKLGSKGFFISQLFPVDVLNFDEDRVKLSPGSTLFFTTDGLTEQGSQGGYYMHRLPDVFYANAHLPPELIKQAVLEDFRQFNNGSQQGKDDITFKVIKVEEQTP